MCRISEENTYCTVHSRLFAFRACGACRLASDCYSVRSLPRHCEVLSPTTEAGIRVEVWSVVEESWLVKRCLSFVFIYCASSLTPAPLLDILISATPRHRHGGAWLGFKAAFADSVDGVVSSRYHYTASCTSMSPKKPPRSSVSLPSLRFALAAFLLSDPI